jgi:DNA-binding winged helix-turn-helix (wHTH) protein
MVLKKSVRLGSCTLDVGRQRLFGPDGPLELRPKTFAVLCYLAANPGRVIGKDELLKAVWSDVTVTDDAITHCISEVRRAMGTEDQKLIRTVPRRGYLLAIKAESIVETVDAQRVWSRWDRIEDGKRDLLRFMRSNHLAVLATISSSGQPLASVVSYVVTDQLTIIVDTNRATGKSMNIRHNPKVALAIGWENRQTLELTGSGEVLAGAELTEARTFYASIYPERTRQLEPIIAGFDCIRIRLSWLRFSDFQHNPASIYTLDLQSGAETREARLSSAGPR